MSLIDFPTLNAAKKYIKKSLLGAGALKGDKGEKGDTGEAAFIFTGTDVAGDTEVIVDVTDSKVGDLYINSDSYNVYQRTDKLSTPNLWEVVGNIKGAKGDDPYQVAVAEGFVGTRAEWLESLHGESSDKVIVWDAPNLNDDDVALRTWYYYKVDTAQYGSGSAWLDRFDVPADKDYLAGDFAFYNGMHYLLFSCDHDILALSAKDTTKFYVLYDEKNMQCQAHFIDIASGTDSSLVWVPVTKSDTVPDGYLEVHPDGDAIQYGKWVQTIFLGPNKQNAYACTISSETDMSGVITTEAFNEIMGNISEVFTETETNLASVIKSITSKFASYILKTDIVDALTSSDATKPVSAKQAKVLNDNKVSKSGDTMTGTLTLTGHGDGKVLLYFNTERQWQVQQGGTAGDSSLDFVSLVDGKAFKVLNAPKTLGLVISVFDEKSTNASIDGYKICTARVNIIPSTKASSEVGSIWLV